MKKSLLALAVSLVAVSSANAAWDTGIDPALIVGNGELVLSVFDPVTKNSYTQDLGVTFNQIRAGYSGTINLDPTHLSVFGGNYSNVQYNVVAVSNRNYTDDTYSQEALTDAGVIYSLVQGQTPWTTGSGNDNISAIGQIHGQVLPYAGSVGFDTNAAANPGYSVTAGGQGYAGEGQWVGYIEANLNRDTSGTNGSTLDLWLKGYTQNDGFGPSLDLLLGTITLDLSGGNGSVTFTSEVPVPAAAWLMGSALLGLGGVARRRRA